MQGPPGGDLVSNHTGRAIPEGRRKRKITMGIPLLFILIAFVLTLLEAFHLVPNPRVNWGWLGIAFWFASLLVGGFRL
jgi:hypothetical protein